MLYPQLHPHENRCTAHISPYTFHILQYTHQIPLLVVVDLQYIDVSHVIQLDGSRLPAGDLSKDLQDDVHMRATPL